MADETPDNPELLGTAARINVQAGAVDALAARQAKLEAQGEAPVMERMAAPTAPTDDPAPGSERAAVNYARSSFSAPPDAGAEFVDPRQSEWYTPQSRGVRASDYERQQATSPGVVNYKEAAQQRAYIERGVQDDFTRGGSFPDIGGLEYQEELNARLADVGLARPMSAYDRATRQRTDIESALRSEYTEQGFHADINGPGYKFELQSQLADAGLAHEPVIREPESERRPGFLERLREDGIGLQWGMGYAAMQGGTALEQMYARSNSGQYVSPEQQGAAAAGLLPALGTALGTVAGVAIPGLGSMGGQFVGQAVGQVAQGVIGANLERGQAAREGGELVATSMGELAAKFREFGSVIEQTGAPVKQLGQVLGSIAAAGPITGGAAAIQGAGAMTSALGEYAQQDYASLTAQLRDPALFPLSQQLRAGGRLDVAGYASAGMSAILDGDMRTLTDRQRDVQDVSLTSGQFQRDERVVGNGLRGTVDRFFWQHGMGGWVPGARHDALADQDRLREAPNAGTPVAAELGRLADQYGAINYEGAQEQGAVGAAAPGVQAAALRGGSAAQVRRAADPLVAALTAQEGTEGRRVAWLQQQLSNPLFGGDRAQLQEEINRAQATIGADGNRVLGIERDAFRGGLEERDAAFGLSDLRGTLGGRSAADLYGGRQRQAEFLAGTAADPKSPLSPTERDALETQAARLRYSSAQAVYGQEEGALAVSGARAGADVARARASGGAGDVYQAQGEQYTNLIAQERQLQSEIERGNLTYDQRQSKMAQIAELQGRAVSLESQARGQYFASEGQILGDTLAADTAGMARSIRAGGNGAFNTAAFGDVASERGLAQQELASARTPGEAAAARRRLAGTGETLDSLLDQYNAYAPDAQDQQAEITTRGQMRRAMLAPYVDGQDPMRAGMAVEGLDRQQLGKLDTNRTERMREGTWRDEDQTTYLKQREGYLDDIADMEHRKLYEAFGSLPEMIGGSPGRGIAAGIIPTEAMTARFTPGPLFGGWGRAGGTTATPGMHDAPAGGMLGGFETAHGTAMAGSGSADVVAAVRELISVVRQGGHLGRTPNVSPAGAVESWRQGLQTF